MRGFLGKARGNDLERSEAIIYKVGGCSQYMFQGGRRRSSSRHHRMEGSFDHG